MNDLIRHLGILVGPPKLRGQAEVDARPDCMSSGDYHKNGKKKDSSGDFGGFRTHTLIPWSGNDSGDGVPDSLDVRYPYIRSVAAQLDP